MGGFFLFLFFLFSSILGVFRGFLPFLIPFTYDDIWMGMVEMELMSKSKVGEYKVCVLSVRGKRKHTKVFQLFCSMPGYFRSFLLLMFREDFDAWIFHLRYDMMQGELICRYFA